MCVPWESNPQPFAQLTQCSTTEPQRNTNGSLSDSDLNQRSFCLLFQVKAQRTWFGATQRRSRRLPMRWLMMIMLFLSRANECLSVLLTVDIRQDCTICMEQLATASGYEGVLSHKGIKPELLGKLGKCGHVYHLLCLVAMYSNGNKVRTRSYQSVLLYSKGILLHFLYSV